MTSTLTNARSRSGAGTLAARALRKCVELYLSQCRLLWKSFPDSLRDCAFGKTYARHLDRAVRRLSDRKQYVATFFLRNRPELALLTRLLEDAIPGSRVKIAILGCSKGAEVYSVAWLARSARPDLELSICAVDISQEMVDFARLGSYSLERDDASWRDDPEATKSLDQNTARDQNAWLFERVSAEEMDAIFTVEGDLAIVRPRWREGIAWLCGDAGDPALQSLLGPQDIVVADRFLCHMKPAAAATCLRNIANLVRPGGYLFVSGIDLDVRTSAALEMGWRPVQELIREVHDGDMSIRSGWPMEYWGLEPFDDRRPDWPVRYASVFQIGDVVEEESTRHYATTHGER
jgi:chemotaxis methyl-accepting protein methylase